MYLKTEGLSTTDTNHVSKKHFITLYSSLLNLFIFQLIIVLLGVTYASAGSCGANLVFRTLSPEGKDAILERHNKLRSKVALGQEDYQPSAANMRKLVC